MGTKTLRKFPQFQDLVAQIESRDKSFDQLQKDLEIFREGWDQDYYLKGQGFEEKWYLPDLEVGDWKSITIPNFWEYEGLEHDGAVWFQKKIRSPSRLQF